MKTVNLADCNVAWINLDRCTENAKRMTQMCHNLGWTKTRRKSAVVIAPPPGTPASIAHFMGCGQSHLDLFRDKTLPCPLLTLEDDVVPTTAFRQSFEVPDDTDAVYLGTSVGYQGYMSCEACPGFLRIGHMLAHHAVVYLTDKYRDAVAELSQQYLYEQKQPFDLATAALQLSHKVLAAQVPYFVQWNGAESANKWQHFTDKPLVNKESRFPS